MIPRAIVEYLEKHDVSYERIAHRRAVSAQQLAAVMHMKGRRVAKSVLVKAGGQTWIAVLPATEDVDLERLSAVLGTQVRLMKEAEFEGLFPGCEPGAEPPFGGLYGLPVVVDSSLADESRITFRAGSHEEAVVIAGEDFFRLENAPLTASIGHRRGAVLTEPPGLLESRP